MCSSDLAAGFVVPGHRPTAEGGGQQFNVVATVPGPGSCPAQQSTVLVISYDPDYCANPTAGPCYDRNGNPV